MSWEHRQLSYQSTTRWATATPRRSKPTAALVGVCVWVCVWIWNILCQHRVDRLEAVVGVIADLFDGEARVSSIDVSVLKLEM